MHGGLLSIEWWGLAGTLVFAPRRPYLTTHKVSVSILSSRPRFCVECGAALPSEARFCPACGSRVASPEPAAPAEAPGQEPAPARPVVPTELQAKFEEARRQLAGDRREVVVLFADLKGYTAMAETMDPEEVGLLMQDLLGQLAACVRRYEGHVDKYIGDAIMALFGAPLAHENDAERAVLAALDMVNMMDRLRAERSQPLGLRVGLNLGEVVAAHMGSLDQLQYTVMGDTVNVASRLEGAAEPNTILVSESLHGRISDRFETLEMPPLTLKGKSEPLRAYRVLRFLPSAAGPRQGRTPFVGRTKELERLELFFREVEAARETALLIEAEPGTGKSRLIREALARTGVDFDRLGISFSQIDLPGLLPIPVDLFLQILGLDGASSSAEDAKGRAAEVLGEEASQHAAAIDELARTAAGEVVETPLADAEASRQNRWLVLAAFLKARSRERPLVVVVEDAHWADESVGELLGFLLVTVAEAPVGFLLSARPGSQFPWLPAGVPVLGLGPLAQADIEAILGTLLDRLRPGVRRELIARSQGNPLYVEELARSLQGRPDPGSASRSVPGTLQGLIQSRVDRLLPPVRSLLQMASVLGERAPVSLLARMYQLESQPVDFESALEKLEAEGFLEPGGDGEVGFHHALMQEVAYGALLIRIRKVLHESAARLGEEMFVDRREAEAPFFAHHYWQADLRTEAAPHLWTAGQAAAREHHLPAAERWLGRLTEVLAEDPGILTDLEEHARVHRIYGNVLLSRGILDEAEREFRNLSELGRRESEPAWVVEGLKDRGWVAWYHGRLDEARSLFEEGIEQLVPADDRLAAELHNGLGAVHTSRGDPDLALRDHEQALALRERLEDKTGMAKSHINIGNVFMGRHDYDRAETNLKRALALATEVSDRRLRCMALNNLGCLSMDKGEWKRSLSRFRHLEELAEETGHRLLRYLSLVNQGECLLRLGRISEALRCFSICVSEGDQVMEPTTRFIARVGLFEAYLRAMADEAARKTLSEIVELAAQPEMESNIADARLAEGRWEAAHGNWDGALEAFREASVAARRYDQPLSELLAQAHLSRALAHLGLTEEVPREIPSYTGTNRLMQALLTYLTADAKATAEPTRETAEALAEAGRMAAELGEVALERAAFERLGDVLSALGDLDQGREALTRASRAMRAIEEHLPDELRDGFLHPPRNIRLRELLAPGLPSSVAAPGTP